ncbi:MAG: molybdenum ABC transporter ATP-binding protein [Woeseiaceae bacterium]
MIRLHYKLHRDAFVLDVDVELPMQGITGLFGASGAGKTTLLRCIAGLEQASTGKLAVDGETWEDSDTGEFRPVRQRSIGYVFQEPRLFDHLTVKANIEYGRKRREQNGGADFDHVIELLGLGELLTRHPLALSGGEAQRVAIARALLCSPRFVLMDEPLASLDQPRRDEILPFLDKLHGESDTPIIYVSHNIDEVCRLCDHLVVIERGRVATSGALQEVLVNMDVPALDGDHAGSVIEGTAGGYDERDGLTRLEFSGGELWVPGTAAPQGAALRLRIRASDVSLCLSRPERSTILNILRARVEAIHGDEGPSALVRLVLGNDHILARVTKRSIRELGLQPGDDLYAQIKSVAVRSWSESP